MCYVLIDGIFMLIKDTHVCCVGLNVHECFWNHLIETSAVASPGRDLVCVFCRVCVLLLLFKKLNIGLFFSGDGNHAYFSWEILRTDQKRATHLGNLCRPLVTVHTSFWTAPAHVLQDGTSCVSRAVLT